MKSSAAPTESGDRERGTWDQMGMTHCVIFTQSDSGPQGLAFGHSSRPHDVVDWSALRPVEVAAKPSRWSAFRKTRGIERTEVVQRAIGA